MDESQFSQLVAKARQSKLFWCDGEADPPATDAQINLAEEQIGARFPDEYTFFVKQFGGGYFAYANVFSVFPDSKWNLNAINKKYRLRENFVAVSDDQCGGYYGFIRDGNVLSKESFY